MGQYTTYKEFIDDLLAPVAAGKQLSFGVGGGEMLQSMAGLPSEVFFKDVVANVELCLLGGEYFRQNYSVTWDIYNCEARGLGQKVTFSEYGLPDIDSEYQLIQSEADFAKLKWESNPLETESFKSLIEGYDMVAKLKGRPTTYFSGVTSTFCNAVELMGFAKVVDLIKRKPDVAHEYFRIIVDNVQAPVIKALSEKYPGIFTKFSDAWERVPNISPKVQREFVYPYYDRIRRKCKDYNITLGWWNTYGEGSMPDPKAYILEKVPYSLGLSNMNVEGIDPKIYYELALEKQLPLSVYIPAPVMVDGPADKIIEFAREMAKQRIGVEKFSLFAAVPATTPIEHIDAAIAALNAYAVLPCPATPEEFDAIKVNVPKRTQSFTEFIKERAAEKAYGFSYHWLKDCKNIK
jgi:hypothetical protein